MKQKNIKFIFKKVGGILLSFAMILHSSQGLGNAIQAENELQQTLIPIQLDDAVRRYQLVRSPSQLAPTFLGRTRPAEEIKYFQDKMKNMTSLPSLRREGMKLILSDKKQTATIEIVDLDAGKFLINGKSFVLDRKMPLPLMVELIEKRYLTKKVSSSAQWLFQMLVSEAYAGPESVLSKATKAEKGFKRALTAEELKTIKEDMETAALERSNKMRKAQEEAKDLDRAEIDRQQADRERVLKEVDLQFRESSAKSKLKKFNDIYNSRVPFVASIGFIAWYLGSANNEFITNLCDIAIRHNPKLKETLSSDGFCGSWFRSQNSKTEAKCKQSAGSFEMFSAQHTDSFYTRWTGNLPSDKEKADKGKDVYTFEIKETIVDAQKKAVLKFSAEYYFKNDKETGKPVLIEVKFPEKQLSLKKDQQMNPEEKEKWAEMTYFTDLLRASMGECEQTMYQTKIDRAHREVMETNPALYTAPKIIKPTEATK